MKMKRNIILLLCVVAILGGALFFLNQHNKKQDGDEPETEPAQSIAVFQTEADNITEVRLENDSTTLNLVKKEDQWHLVGDDTAVLKQNGLTSLLAILSDVRAVDELGEADEAKLKEYGLHAPLAKADYTLADGTAHRLELGASLFNGNKYYFRLGTDNKVYTMDSIDAGILLSGMIAFRDGIIISSTTEKIKEVTLQRPNGTIRLAAKPEAKEGEIQFSAWSLVEPHPADTDDTVLTKNLLSPLSTLTANGFVDGVTDYSAYGLANPACRVNVVLEDSVVEFSIGYKDGTGNYYVKLPDKAAVYLVSETSLPFIELKTFDVIDKHVALLYVNDVKQLDIQNGADTTAFTISRQQSVDANDEESTLEICYLNGKEIDMEDFKSYYQTLLGLRYSQEGGDSYQGTPAVRIAFTQNSGEVFTVEFYEYDSADYLVKTNTTSNVRIQKKYVDKVLSELEKLKNQ